MGMRYNGIIYYKAWIKSKKMIVKVLEIDYIKKEIGYVEDYTDTSKLTYVGFYDVILMEDERRA